MPLFLRNALFGAAPWTALLAVGMVMPILVITVLFVRDTERLTTAARAERAGIVHLTALLHVLRAASDVRYALACGQTPGSATIDGAVAALSDLERSRPLIGRDWVTAVAGWRGKGDLLLRADALVSRVSPLFVTISDRSGMTYDPEVAGINLADALAYRLPRAFDDLQAVGIMLCPDSRVRVARKPLAIARLSGSASNLLQDTFGDIDQAVALDPSLTATVEPQEHNAAFATAATFAMLERFEERPGTPQFAEAARLDARAASGRLYNLIETISPALDRIAVQRIADLRRRHDLTLIPGLLAMVAAALFVLLGARSVLQRAELLRMKRTAAELEYHATHDGLTGLANRAAFATSLEKMLAASSMIGGTVAVLFIDLDNFKLVNDSLGHAAGDRVLGAVAKRLQTVCEHAQGEIVARFGGDEFAMLVHDSTVAKLLGRVDRIVEGIRDQLSRPVPLGPDFAQRVVVSASVGIASPDEGEQAASLAVDLLRDADIAMYEAKARGRAQAATFGPAMRERALQKLLLTTDLRGAAERNEFILAREPIVRLHDGAQVGSEALIRWLHPRLGMLSPGKFLRVAEESGAIVQIGRWMLDAAVQGLAASAGKFVHVNLTVADLMEETLLPSLSRLLERYRVEPYSLAVEITEGSLVRSGGQAEKMLERLRALGVRIWIDDFGVEYSSLRYLDRLPVDGVKIDRSFVGGKDGNLASPSIVKMILELAESFGLDVIAEGIETTHQRDALIQLGCTYGQGYLYLRNSADLQTATAEI